MTPTVDDLVSVDRGEIDRRIFSDDEIFEQEMSNIFGRAWLFLCHETQIRGRGDFFQTVMGKDNILVVRQRDGSVKALLNTCAHRGNAVCRAEEGTARNFLCTYHGWSYNIDGRLQGVPGQRVFYQPEFDRSHYRLAEVAQVASYQGFIFGTHDATAPPLEEFLGATGRLGLDLLACRGDMEVVPGIQKFIIDCNWKFALDNLYDWYHPPVTHASAFAKGVLNADPASSAASAESGDDTDGSGQSDTDPGSPVSGTTGTNFEHSVVLGEYGHAIGGPIASSPGNFDPDPSWRSTDTAREALGPVGATVAGHAGIFPTTWLTTTSQLSLRIPRSVNRTEIWWFTFVDRSASESTRSKTISLANRVFGPAGLLEQDDGENWAQSTMQTYGEASRRIPHLVNMGLGRGRIIKEHGLARIDGPTSEYGQLWTYHSWLQWMKRPDWQQLRLSTTPGEQL